MTDFTGKRALVTGGSKGIGAGIAAALAERGAQVVISSRTQSDLDAAAAEMPGEVLPLACDVTDKAAVADLAAQIEERIGGVDILVNNAGMAGSHKFKNHPDDLWHSIQDVNVTSVYYVSQAVVPGMIERGWGRVINMGSLASKVAMPYMMAYVTSKHALLGLTRAMAVELNRYGVTANIICPGYVDTPMVSKAARFIAATTRLTEEEAVQSMADTSPQKRLMEVEEVVRVALMLAGEGAKGITGQAINVDGGAVMF